MSQLTTGGQQFLKHSWDSWAVLFQGEQKGGRVREAAWICRPMVLKGQCQNLPDHTVEILSLNPVAQGIYSLGLSVLSKVPAKVKMFPPSQPCLLLFSQGQRACTGLQRRDTLRVPGPQWRVIQSRMGHCLVSLREE